MSEALNREDSFFIDVRSPKEFNREKIPGAVNIALFNDEEHKELGIIYKIDGALAAKRKGLEFASSKLTRLVDHISHITHNKIPILYCWRGGLRSLSLSQILYLCGIPALRLKGGYKSYRRLIYNSLCNYRLRPKPVVLHGLTGTGKTLIINRLLWKGYPVIDLEGLALHRGSTFGKIGFNDNRTQKDFEAMLWTQLEENKSSPFIVIEKEGRKIGPLFVPPFLSRSLEEGVHILLEAPLEVRAKIILDEYIKTEITSQQKEEYIKGINSLSPRLGKKMTKQLMSLIEGGDFYEAILILCRDYYDLLYLDARADRYKYSAIIDTSSIASAIDKITDFIDHLFPKNTDYKTTITSFKKIK